VNKFENCNKCGKLIVGETITISVTEYEQLRRLVLEVGSQKNSLNYRSLSHSAIARNRKLADFIVERFESMTLAEIHAAALTEFGSSVPSPSSIHRFIRAVQYRR